MYRFIVNKYESLTAAAFFLAIERDPLLSSIQLSVKTPPQLYSPSSQKVTKPLNFALLDILPKKSL